MNLRKKLLLGLAVLLLLLFGVMYVVVVQHAESLLQHFVVTQSKGKMELKVQALKVNLLPIRLELDSPEFQTNDSTRLETAYQIKAKSIILRLKSLWPILFNQPIGVDSMVVQSPLFEVYKYGRVKQEHISLPEEMGLVYQSMEKVLAHLYLEYLRVQDAKFVVYNPGLPEKKPLSVSNLNLTINKVNNQSGAANERFLYADRILLELFNQEIVLPDGYHGMKFKRFRLSTGSQTIRLDSCFLYGKPTDSSKAEFSSFIDSLRIYKFDFNALANKSVLKMDSALCLHPEVNILMPLGAKNTQKGHLKEVLLHRDSLDKVLKKMLGNLDIRYLAVRDAKIHLETTIGGKRNFFDLDKSQFSMEKLLVDSDPLIPLRLDRFKLQLHNYTNYSADSLYLIGFDEVQLINKNISLTNFRFEPTLKNHARRGNSLNMASFEFNEIEWPRLLYENRIVAGRMTLVKPRLQINLPAAKEPTSRNTFHLDMLKDFRQKIDVAGISVRAGSISLNGGKGLHVTVNEFDASLDVKQLLNSASVVQAVDAVDTLMLAKGEFRNGEVSLKLLGCQYLKHGRTLRIKNLTQSKLDNSLSVKLKNSLIAGINIRSWESFHLSGIGWESGEVVINPKGVSRRVDPSRNSFKPTELSIGSVNGGTTKLIYTGANLEASTVVNHITTDQIEVKTGQKPVIQNLKVDGKSFSLLQNKLKGSFSGFQIEDRKSSNIDNVEIRMPFNQEIVTFQVPRLRFSVNISESVKGNLIADFIEMERPIISFQSQNSDMPKDSSVRKGRFPLLNIQRLSITEPKFVNLPTMVREKMKLDPGVGRFNFKGIITDSNRIHLDTIRFLLAHPNFSNSHIRMVPNGQESLSLSASDFNFSSPNLGGQAKWSLKLDEFQSNAIQLSWLKGDSVGNSLGFDQFRLQKLVLGSELLADNQQLIRHNDQFRLSAGNFFQENGKIRVKSHQLLFDRSTNSLSVDSLAFLQLLDREAFMKDKQFRTSYMNLFAGAVKLKGINLERLAEEKVLEIKKANLNDLRYTNYIDKRLPMQHGIEKPMLTDLLTRINSKLVVDSLVLKNGSIVAEEINDKTLQIGFVTLTRIRGGITGIRNFDFKKGDSLKFNLYAKLLDTAEIRLNYSQAYLDSLSSFHMKAIVSGFDLTALNPILKPFASAQVTRGYLDTIRMSVVGRKYVAFGIMRMYYHDLHVEYLNKGVEAQPTLKTRLISFFANRIVRNKKQLGSGDVYAERDPEKGFVNYWVKIFLGGVFTNTGVKTDRKQIKKYARSIKKHHVPPIPTIPVDY